MARIIGAGIIPAAVEMMDRLTIEAAEAAVHPHYPPDAEALLIVELDGESQQVAENTTRAGRDALAAHEEATLKAVRSITTRPGSPTAC